MVRAKACVRENHTMSEGGVVFQQKGKTFSLLEEQIHSNIWSINISVRFLGQWNINKADLRDQEGTVFVCLKEKQRFTNHTTSCHTLLSYPFISILVGRKRLFFCSGLCWLFAYLYCEVAEQVSSCNQHSRQHEGHAQTHAPAPCPGLAVHRQSRLCILRDKDTTLLQQSEASRRICSSPSVRRSMR